MGPFLVYCNMTGEVINFLNKQLGLYAYLLCRNIQSIKKAAFFFFSHEFNVHIHSKMKVTPQLSSEYWTENTSEELEETQTVKLTLDSYCASINGICALFVEKFISCKAVVS